MKHQFTKVEFSRFKAFKNFRIDLKHFNILVGPNNAGKSTILAGFRILAAALRRAYAKKAILVNGPTGITHGHKIDLSSISVAEENIFFNYDDENPAQITFTLSNKNKLILYFPERDSCLFIPDAQGRHCSSPNTFEKEFNCPIGFVPILGPVEHHENLYEKRPPEWHSLVIERPGISEIFGITTLNGSMNFVRRYSKPGLEWTFKNQR